MLSELSHSELLEKYMKIVTETDALQASLVKEEDKVRELLDEASLAEKRHTQLEEEKRKLKETAHNFQRELDTAIENMELALEMDINTLFKNNLSQNSENQQLMDESSITKSDSDR